MPKSKSKSKSKRLSNLGIILATHCTYERRRLKKTDSYWVKYAVTSEERHELIDKIGETGLVLFEYYLQRAGIGNSVLDDEAAMLHFGWAKAKAKRIRLALIHEGFFFVEQGKGAHGSKFYAYHLGKDRVDHARQQQGSAAFQASVHSAVKQP